jgi:hypothetical protein
MWLSLMNLLNPPPPLPPPPPPPLVPPPPPGGGMVNLQMDNSFLREEGEGVAMYNVMHKISTKTLTLPRGQGGERLHQEG